MAQSIVFFNIKNAVYQVNISSNKIQRLEEFNHGTIQFPYEDLEYDSCSGRLCALQTKPSLQSLDCNIYCIEPFSNSSTIVNIAESLPGLPFLDKTIVSGIEFCNGIMYFHTTEALYKANSFIAQKGIWSNGKILQIKVDCANGQVFAGTTTALYVTDLSLMNEPILAASYPSAAAGIRLGLWPQESKLLLVSDAQRVYSMPVPFDFSGSPVSLMSEVVLSLLTYGVTGSDEGLLLLDFNGNLDRYSEGSFETLIQSSDIIDGLTPEYTTFIACDSSNQHCEVRTCDFLECRCCSGMCSGFPAEVNCTCGEDAMCPFNDLYSSGVCSFLAGHSADSFPSVPNTCTECPSLLILNGNYTYSPKEPSYLTTAATLQCAEGYNPNPSEVVERTCTTCGYNGQNYTCDGVVCGTAMAADGVTLSYSDPSYTSPSTVNASCSPGGALFGSAIRTCQVDGTWSGVEPVCISCPVLTDPPFGSYLLEVSPPNATTTLVCERGYEPSGIEVRTCQSNDTWSGSNVTCNLITCDNYGMPEGGTISFTHDVSVNGSTLVVSCNAGYKIIGNETRTCQETGAWSGEEARCEVRMDDFICAVQRPFVRKNGPEIQIHSIHLGTQRSITPIGVDGRKRSLPLNSKLAEAQFQMLSLPIAVTPASERFGLFQCSAVLDGEAKYIIAITQSPSGPYSVMVTHTVCLNKDIRFKAVLSGNRRKWRWRFNKNIISDKNRRDTFRIKGAKHTDAGIYEAYINSRYNRPHAVIKLNVRNDCDCPGGCTTNDGECVDDECLCPPRRYGKSCQLFCPNGYFGSSCQFSCSDIFGKGFATCGSILFCFGEPRGCMCYSGRRAPTCD